MRIAAEILSLSRVVLDASALLALLGTEPGSETVAESIPGAVINTVNLSEVVAKLMERGVPEAAVRSALREVELDVQPFGEDLAYRAGILRLATRSAGLSFGDRACLASGQQLSVAVLTADRNWRSLEVGVEIRFLR
ncbi:MAG TPA: type II toxin-antitoxin system VapC family toxin [Thermoanaerobaculia bacterium]|nr:type II toxin-antitoxin system VapC family toxin [Thermoanaerobaculia bacterium]